MKHVVLVRHNSYLFKGTVEENLKMGNPAATTEEMEAVLRKVNLFGFLKTQAGLQTQLQEKAGNLSGGQCQRLVIARALLKAEAAVYIFDEATSNIDAESEELIMNVIQELAQTRTVLLISHRLANVVKSDRIYFLKDGEIRESGRHEDLIKADGEPDGCMKARCSWKTMENGEENDERAYKYNKTQKRHPDHGKPDRSGKAAASEYAGSDPSWNSRISVRHLSDDPGSAIY